MNIIKKWLIWVFIRIINYKLGYDKYFGQFASYIYDDGMVRIE